MIKKMTLFFICITLSSISLANGYFGFNLSSDKLKDSESSNSFSTMNLKFGKQFSDHISGELRYGFGFKNDSEKFIYNGIPIAASASIENTYGLYGILNLSPESQISPYGLLGYTKTKIQTTFGAPGAGLPRSRTSDTLSGLTYGLGIALNSSEQFSFNLEYTRYTDEIHDTDFDLDRLSIGFISKF